MRSRSGSVASNTSNKELSSDNIPINVSICDDKSKSPNTPGLSSSATNSDPTAIKLNIRPVHTVANILEFLSASTTLPQDVRLIMDGKPLDPSSTVAELKLRETATLQLDPPTRRSASPTQSSPELPKPAEADVKPSQSGTSTPASATSRTSTPSGAKKSNRPRCGKAGCKTPAQPIVGDCGFCQKRFCGKHRMLESHNCEGLEDARQADKERNAAKLEGERTVMLRGL
jgi:AN1-like Zinc finger/Ubiquitin-2 like Rad60 SUMO-like